MAEEPSKPKVANYDFRHPVFLSEMEMRRLRLRNEDFTRYLGARLALFLRMEAGLKVADLAMATYAKMTEAFANPTHLCLFKAEPLPGVGVLDIAPGLALALADRMLGGRGRAANAARPLTEIEVALVEDILQIVLEEWCGQWKEEQELRPVIIGHENNGRYLQTSASDAIMLVLAIEVAFGECVEKIRIGMPYHALEPLVRKMQARRQKENAVSPTEKHAAWAGAYDHIAVPVRAEWDAFEISLREIASLRVGDVIEMPASMLQQTRILLNGTPKFIGTVGLDAERTAVQITHKLNLQGTVNSDAPTQSHGRKNP